MKQYYKTLGLKEAASQQDIQTAYERLSKELDPKNNDNQEFFIEEYKKVQDAYKALSNSSILGTEKGVNSFKKTEPKSGKKTPEIDKEILKSSQKNKIKKIMKRIFLIISILIALGIAVFTWWSFQTKLNNLVYSQSETRWAENEISNDIVYLKETMQPFNGNLSKYKTNYSGKFVNGKKNGLHREFHYDQIKRAGEYIDGLPEGTHKQWNYSGQLLSEVNYKKGKRVGLSKKWNKEGLLIAIDYNQNEIVKYLQEYLITSNNLNLIEGSYRTTLNNVTDYEFTIINLSGQFYGAMTNRFSNNLNNEEATTFYVGDVKFFASKTANIDKFNATWFMADRSLEKFELIYNVVKNQINKPVSGIFKKQ